MDVKAVHARDSAGRRAPPSRELARADTAAKNRALAAHRGRDPRARRSRSSRPTPRTSTQAKTAGRDAAFVDRLTLDAEAASSRWPRACEQVAALADPVGEISERVQRPTGIEVARMRVPLGVIGIIYESRPNVTADAAALCLKSGNACILRGGSRSAALEPRHRRVRARRD